ncbi:hypothetical protein [Azospirillum sp.]|uniref:hypothetical protein n=1 Tax=Azospirillum sp. TaxID=34012 RepID=UPI003D735EEB
MADGPPTHRQPVCISVINTPVDEVAESLRHGLAELGFAPTVVPDALIPGVPTIIMGGHQLGNWAPVPADAVIFNLEQLGAAPHITPTYLAKLGGHTVWDYSRTNIAWLRERGINASAQWIRVGYSPGLTRIPQAPAQDIDVVFYGSLSPRRIAVLQALKERGLNVAVLHRMFGAERDGYIARAKVVLNVNYYDAQIFEIVRTSFLLSNRKATVIEAADDGDVEPDFRTAAAVAPYNRLVEACCALVADDARRRALEEEAFRVFSGRSQAEFLREAAGTLPVRSASPGP